MMRCTHMTRFAQFTVPTIANETMKNFEPNSPEAKAVLAECLRLRQTTTECPIIIGGKAYTTPNCIYRCMPSDHGVRLAKTYNATPELARLAIETALKAGESWRRVPFRERAAVFLKAAHLLSTKYATTMRAATMLGQSKTVWQAEIDCIAEACDFLRWNVHFAEQLYTQQPCSPAGVWNTMEYRPLEGFFSAITPFNFTAIAANLAGTPALMGNVVVWKPSPSAVLSNFVMMRVFEEAGLPPGVINFVPCEPTVMTGIVNTDARLAGVTFTGSTRVFTEINKQVYGRLETYRNFPRITGETGGKDFHLIHPSADLKHAAAATLRAAFEYQGQKCSACSRLYVPKSCWKEMRELLLVGQRQLKMGQPDDLTNFMCAVIDELAFAKHKKYLALAQSETDRYTILAGGTCDQSRGYFVAPTIVQTRDPTATLMREEIFGPIVTTYVYDDGKPDFWPDVCQLVDSTTPYALTGAIFARDRAAITAANECLRYTCGNYYINDKCTGAVVGQQPFGGARMSGSNDKPGSALFLNRFVSARAIKEGFDLTPSISYPHQHPDVYKL